MKLGKNIQVINLSQPGYSIENSPHLYIAIGQYFEPDIIVTSHAWNDFFIIKNYDEDLNFQRKLEPRESVKNTLLDYFPFQQILSRLIIVRRRIIQNEVLENRLKSTTSVIPNISKESINWIGSKYRNLIDLTEGKPIFIIKQGNLLSENNAEFDDFIPWEFIGMDKASLVNAYERYFEMLEGLEGENVHLIPANTQMPKNLEYFEDSVHMTQRGLRFLGEYVCNKIYQEIIPSSK